ncbi:mannitol 1-phosphate dehydrogenase [Acephala macrosclerotiorum]|nr:mannitol 1-phosphate dehydrogenase [Acephala macrosclerotiorum]
MAVESSPIPIHIAIIGGGIGGAVLGVALSKYPHVTFTIYETRAAFGEIGAGLAFGANAHNAMRLINPTIWEGYKSRASFNGWEEKQNIWFDFTVGERGENEGKRIIEVAGEFSAAHRVHVLEELIKLLPEGCAEFNKKVVDVDQSGEKVVCKFADGTKAEADAVVGCDGIRSACRKLVYSKDFASATFTNKVAYRGLVPMKLAEAALGREKANNRQMYLGHGGHFLTFPVANGALMNVVAFHTREGAWDGEWVQQLQKDELQKDFSGFGESVTKIIELIQAPDVWAIFDHPPVPSYHNGRLCLLGDAAHATSPHFGQGAGMALEDAYVLSNLFGKCSSTLEIERAFEAYDYVRVPRANRVVAVSREQGKTLDMEGDGVGDDLEKLAENLNTRVRWIWNEDLEAHLATAMEKFE